MKALLLSAVLSLVAGTASAACFGTGAFQSCTDSSGNSYTVQRLGNQTFTNGYNAQTGNSWSQNSMRSGNMTIHNGVAGNGNSWNMTEQSFGSIRTLNGTNSFGESFSYTCTTFGCN